MSATDSANAILTSILYATISTVDQEGRPWAAPQFISYDDDMKHIYWCASRSSQHARNVMLNHRAFITVYDSSVGPGEGNGVYLQVTAEEIIDVNQQEMVMNRLIERHQGIPYWTLKDVQAHGSLVALFRATIEKTWVNDGKEEEGHFVLYRKPIHL